VEKYIGTFVTSQLVGTSSSPTQWVGRDFLRSALDRLEATWPHIKLPAAQSVESDVQHQWDIITRNYANAQSAATRAGPASTPAPTVLAPPAAASAPAAAPGPPSKTPESAAPSPAVTRAPASASPATAPTPASIEISRESIETELVSWYGKLDDQHQNFLLQFLYHIRFDFKLDSALTNRLITVLKPPPGFTPIE
jgi:hypothetical protein